MGRDVRYNLVVQAGEEEDGYFGYGGEVGVRSPDLVAEKSEIFCWWNDTALVSKVQMKMRGFIRWDQLPHAQESILQHQPN